MKIIISQGREVAAELDSPEEALFYSLMHLRKIPVERTDSRTRISVNGSSWWCPGFFLPETGIYVEIKGPDPEDRFLYDVWRWPSGRKLAVLRREELEVLLTRASSSSVVEQLKIWAR
jgi:hypothetical protein